MLSGAQDGHALAEKVSINLNIKCAEFGWFCSFFSVNVSIA